MRCRARSCHSDTRADLPTAVQDRAVQFLAWLPKGEPPEPFSDLLHTLALSDSDEGAATYFSIKRPHGRYRLRWAIDCTGRSSSLANLCIEYLDCSCAPLIVEQRLLRLSERGRSDSYAATPVAAGGVSLMATSCMHREFVVLSVTAVGVAAADLHAAVDAAGAVIWPR